MSEREMSGTGARDFFNDYVRNTFPQRQNATDETWAYPGDEWVSDDVRAATLDWLFRCAPSSLHEIVEYGPGSGKYTELLLANSQAHVTAFEISEAFLESLEKRCGAYGDRLRPVLTDWKDNAGILRALGEQVGQIDFVFGIDVLWMMDFQSAFVYLLSAAVMLRRGGKIAFNFGDGVGDSGFQRMVRDAGRHSAFSTEPCTRFHWINAALLEDLLPRLGFGDLSIEHGPAGDLDIARLYVGAELLDPSLAADLASALQPAGDSTNRHATTLPVDNRQEA